MRCDEDILHDQSSTGRERPWRAKKQSNMKLSEIYRQVNEKKADRLENCGTVLTFKQLENGQKKLDHMSSCRVRLCPMCSWRRSIKLYAQVSKVMDAAKSSNYAYIMATFTVANCSSEALSDVITSMMSAYNKLKQLKSFKAAIHGWYRGLEVTHNTDPLSKSYDTYHPHFHCIFAVDKGYFMDKRYIQRDEWAKMWRKAMKLEYTPMVDIRCVKGKTAKAVAEISKYTVKDVDYIVSSDYDLSVRTVRTLDQALHKRRLVAFGGVFKALHKQLNLDDPIDGDLVNIDGESDLDKMRTEGYVSYVWSAGYNNYYRD
jgi:Plasmid rolling circle replication initiator protein and truncated derivatives